MIRSDMRGKGTHKHGSIASGTPQPEWNVSDNGKGLLTGTAKIFFDYKTGKSGSIDKLPVRGDKHPYDERLVCVDVRTEYGTNDIAYVSANYVGLLNDPAGIEWNLNCPMEEQSITLHPAFQTEKGKAGSMNVLLEKPNKANKFKAKWDTEQVVLDEKFFFERFNISQATLDNDLVGVESYKVPRPTFTMTLYTANQAMMFDIVRDQGMQFTKIPFAPDWTDVSKLTRSWLMCSVSVTEYGGIFYKINIEYILSGKSADGTGKTWNKLIYESFQKSGGEKK